MSTLSAYASPLTRTPLADCRSMTRHSPLSSRTTLQWLREMLRWSMAMSLSSVRPIFSSERMQANSRPASSVVVRSSRGADSGAMSTMRRVGAPLLSWAPLMMDVASCFLAAAAAVTWARPGSPGALSSPSGTSDCSVGSEPAAEAA